MRSEKELRKRAEAAQRELDEEQEDWDGLGDRFLQALPRWVRFYGFGFNIGLRIVHQGKQTSWTGNRVLQAFRFEAKKSVVGFSTILH